MVFGWEAPLSVGAAGLICGIFVVCAVDGHLRRISVMMRRAAA
jgi:hypothetical protein